MNLEAIPQALKDIPNWVCWKYITRDDVQTKLPVSAKTGKAAASDTPGDWCDFEQAVMYSGNPGINGIGFVFSLETGLVGIDLDNSLDESGNLEAWASPIVNLFATYTERSPSQRGVKMWVYGTIPENKGRRKGYQTGAVEIYNQTRFFTVTGNSYPGKSQPIASRQELIDRLYNKVFGPPIKPPPPKPRATVLTDAQITVKVTGEKTGKGRRLWDGDTSGYTSASEADLALMMKLGFYVGNDTNRIIALAKQSGLYRGKMDRDDYMTTTAARAIEMLGGNYYDGNGKAPPEIPLETKTQKNASTAFLNRVRETIEGKRQNISWRWPILTHCARALVPGAITVLCGGGGSTKSLLVSDASLDWLAQEIPFAMFHLEEDLEFHLRRALSQLVRNSNVTIEEWQRANPETILEYVQKCSNVLDDLGRHITCEPESNVKIDDLLDWIRDRCKEGARVLTIDPITMATTGDKSWIEDQRFIVSAQRIIRQNNASLLLVTHPKGGQKGAENLDRVAGGLSYVRFTSCVLWLEAFDETLMTCKTSMGPALMPINRIIQIWKCRNGTGTGVNIGYLFEKDTLKFTEQGIIVKDKKENRR